MLAGDPLGAAPELCCPAEPGQLGETLLEAQPDLPAPGGSANGTP
jgi:hypothetical protein